MSGAMEREHKAVVVKNKAPAARQITAEQILREALDHQDVAPASSKREIADLQELEQYRMEKRKQFEDSIRMQRLNTNQWMKYAQFEVSQKEFARARSIFERALDTDYRNVTFWLRYAEMEMKHGFVNRARNVWDRAVSLLPRQDQLWYKYSLMEETLGNIAGARGVFERWLKWVPEPKVWSSYIKIEEKHGDMKKVRSIFERLLAAYPSMHSYVKYASYEEKHGNANAARRIFERAVDELGEDQLLEEGKSEFYLLFSAFEERQKESERALAILRFCKAQMKALDMSSAEISPIDGKIIQLEKMFGSKNRIEESILLQRREEYEAKINENERDYDTWFDLIRLEYDFASDAMGPTRDWSALREVFERAISKVPLVAEKLFWKRYVWLWIYYAVFEEIDGGDMEKALLIYKTGLSVIPHDKFTFAKLWILYSECLIRSKDLALARKVLGRALGMCPKPKLFDFYISLEESLGEMDRCRRIYEKHLEYSPENCAVWIAYAEMEAGLEEYERVRGIFELAVSQSVLDMPEKLWRAYIDYETERGDYEYVRGLYARLLEKTNHVKVWIGWAQFEAEIEEYVHARNVFKKADEMFKESGLGEQRVLLLESWVDFENEFGTEETVASVEKKAPERVKKKRRLLDSEGKDIGWEEYYDYIFPDDQKEAPKLKLLEMAKKWKKQKL